MKLKFMTKTPLNTKLASCPFCGEDKNIWVHSQKEKRYCCSICRKTFSETKGTVFYGLHYPMWMVVLILTLLAYGCPVPAISAAFFIDERTVTAWLQKAGGFVKQVQENMVCQGQVNMTQVQADEICVTAQGGKVWVATAMDVFSRLFLWGEVSRHRDKKLIRSLLVKVRESVAQQSAPLLFAVDGLPAYPKAILKIFHTKLRTGKPGRPRHISWANLHIVQIVKHRSGYKLKSVCRRLIHGCRDKAYELVAVSQCSWGLFNTSYIERLNATFRARMPTLVRRTRCLARTVTRIEKEVFWSGVVYNFCTVHTSLVATPAMAADLTDHVWSIEELLRFKLPMDIIHAVL